MDELFKIKELIGDGRLKEGWRQLNGYLSDHPEDAEAWELAISLAKPEVRANLRRNADLRAKDNRNEALKRLDAFLQYDPSRSPKKTKWNPLFGRQPDIPSSIHSGIEYAERKRNLNWAIAAIFLVPLCCYSMAETQRYGWIIVGLITFGGIVAYIIGSSNDIEAYEKHNRLPAVPSHNFSARSKPDYNKLVKCRACHSNVAIGASACPSCGIAYPGLTVICPICGSRDTRVLGTQSF